MTERKQWVNPVKNHPPRDSTMKTSGDFRKFTELMAKIVNKREEPKTSSRVPGASDSR